MASILSIPNQLIVAYGASNAFTALGNGSYDGQAYYQIGGLTQGYRRNVWIWDTSAWRCMPIAPIQGTGNPNGVVTPDCEGQSFLATNTANLYIATGLTSSDWTLTN